MTGFQQLFLETISPSLGPKKWGTDAKTIPSVIFKNQGWMKSIKQAQVLVSLRVSFLF